MIISAGKLGNIYESKLRQKWYIAKIKSNSYHIATQNLERQGFETFLPKIEITKQDNKFLIKNVFVFPGYMFVCCAPHIITWTKINSTYGVSKILLLIINLQKYPDLIQILKLDMKLTVIQSKGYVKQGDNINFIRGHLLM